MKKDYPIEQYNEEDRQKVLDLMRGIFASEKMRKAACFNPDFWKWQYKDNPSGEAITILAKDNGVVVGQYANVPVQLKFNGGIQKSALVIDLMVKEPYRRQGLFSKMGQAANKKLSESKLAVSIAFPSRGESYAGFINKLGWFKVGELKTLAKPIMPKIFKDKNVGSDIEVHKIFTFPDGVNHLWNKLKAGIDIGIVRDREYLNWRYFQNPIDGYEVFSVLRGNELVGYFVLKVISVSKIKVGVVVDMLCLDEADIVKVIIDKTESVFLNSGVFLCLALKTRLYEGLLRKFGFKVMPDKLSPKSYTLIARINCEGMDLGVLSNIDNWFLQFGDWDVV